MKNIFIHRILVGISILIVLVSCHQVDESSDAYPAYNEYIKGINKSPGQAVDLVKKAIEFCGGWEAYTQIMGIEYEKTLHKADSLGKIKYEIVQKHRYNLFPEFGVRMDWKEGESAYTIMNNGNQSWKLKDEKLLEDQININSAYNSSHGSQYVLFMPWKLLDPGVKLEYMGMQELPNGLKGEGVQVNYSEGNSTTTTHTWWYYFDSQGKPIANFLKSDQGYSYTEYLDYQEVDGLKFHIKRNSYSSDSTRNNLVLNTVYENSAISMKPLFKKQLFDFKG